MQSKPWYLSKTIWAGILSVLFAAWDAAHSNFPNLPVIPAYVFAILGALGIYGRAAATTVLTK